MHVSSSNNKRTLSQMSSMNNNNNNLLFSSSAQLNHAIIINPTCALHPPVRSKNNNNHKRARNHQNPPRMQISSGASFVTKPASPPTTSLSSSIPSTDDDEDPDDDDDATTGGCSWTDAEDVRLRDGVLKYGDDQWSTVCAFMYELPTASSVSASSSAGKTGSSSSSSSRNTTMTPHNAHQSNNNNNAPQSSSSSRLRRHKTEHECARRWTDVVSLKQKKGPWTEDEDRLVCQLVQINGPKKWSTLAAYVPGRTGKQCRERWVNHLSPDVNKGEWTEAEELRLIEEHERLGNQWCKIAQTLPGRSENAVKNRWNSFANRHSNLQKHAAAAAAAGRGSSSSGQPQRRLSSGSSSTSSLAGTRVLMTTKTKTDFKIPKRRGPRKSTTLLLSSYNTKRQLNHNNNNKSHVVASTPRMSSLADSFSNSNLITRGPLVGCMMSPKLRKMMFPQSPTTKKYGPQDQQDQQQPPHFHFTTDGSGDGHSPFSSSCIEDSTLEDSCDYTSMEDSNSSSDSNSSNSLMMRRRLTKPLFINPRLNFLSEDSGEITDFDSLLLSPELSPMAMSFSPTMLSPVSPADGSLRTFHFSPLASMWPKSPLLLAPTSSGRSSSAFKKKKKTKSCFFQEDKELGSSLSIAGSPSIHPVSSNIKE